MIYTPHRRVIVRQSFKVAAIKVILFENARCTCDTDTIHLNASGVTKKVDIRGQPASMITAERNSGQSTAERTGTRRPIVQFPQMVGRLVVPTDDHGQDRRGGLARIILVEVAHVLVLWGDGH